MDGQLWVALLHVCAWELAKTPRYLLITQDDSMQIQTPLAMPTSKMCQRST